MAFEPIGIADHLKFIRTGTVPAWPGIPRDEDAIKLWLDEDQQGDIRRRLAAIANVTMSSRSVSTYIDHPRTMLDHCVALLRKVASLRDEHRALQIAHLSRIDMVDDLRAELAHKERASVRAYRDKKSAALALLTEQTAKVAERVTSVATRLQKQQAGMLTDERIAFVSNLEAALSQLGLANNPSYNVAAGAADKLTPGSIRETDAGDVQWVADDEISAGNSIAQRIAILNRALSRIAQIRERMGIRIQRDEIELRRCVGRIDEARLKLEQDEHLLAMEEHEREIEQIRLAIHRLETRDRTFSFNYRARIQTVLARYIETCETLGAYSARLASSCVAHGLPGSGTFDAKALIDPVDNEEDDAIIAAYSDALDRTERAWSDRLSRGISCLFELPPVVFAADPRHPGKLVADLTWPEPLKDCMVEGIVLLSDTRISVEIGVEIVTKTSDLNKLGGTVAERESRYLHLMPVPVLAETTDDISRGMVSGDFLANFVKGRKIRIVAAGDGAAQATLRLLASVHGIPRQEAMPQGQPEAPSQGVEIHFEAPPA